MINGLTVTNGEVDGRMAVSLDAVVSVFRAQRHLPGGPKSRASTRPAFPGSSNGTLAT